MAPGAIGDHLVLAQSLAPVELTPGGEGAIHRPRASEEQFVQGSHSRFGLAILAHVPVSRQIRM